MRLTWTLLLSASLVGGCTRELPPCAPGLDSEGLISEEDCDEADQITLYADADGDGYGDASVEMQACEPTDGWVEDPNDCDDTDFAVNPGVEEICGNLIDDDCDGTMNDCDLPEMFSVEDCPVKILGASAGDRAAQSFSLAGDVNGDGISELAIGAPHFYHLSPTIGDQMGELYLVDGTVEGVYDLSDPTGLGYTLATFESDTPSDAFGYDVAVGDVTGNGEPDLVVSAPFSLDTTYKACFAGVVYVFEGPLQKSTSPIATDSAAVAIAGLEYFEAADGYLYCENDILGFNLSVGEVTGDGVADILAGSYANQYLGDYGASYVFSGPLLGEYTANDAWTSVQSSVKEEESYYSQFTTWADLDGDGNHDLLVGNTGDDGTTAVGSDGTEVALQNAGAIYVFYGPMLEGEVDPINDADVVIRGLTENGEFGVLGGYTSATDFDGDGYTDLLVGATGTTDIGDRAGAMYLFSGPLVGELTVEDATAVFFGASAGDEAGMGSAAGDVNGDGVPDLVVTAVNSNESYVNAGAVYVFYGPVAGEYLMTDADVTILGDSRQAALGYSVLGLGDTNNDGFDDIAIAAPDDSENGSYAGALYLCRGAGG
jgi:hypothetical protein